MLHAILSTLLGVPLVLTVAFLISGRLRELTILWSVTAVLLAGYLVGNRLIEQACLQKSCPSAITGD
jgi:hypothetical protein